MSQNQGSGKNPPHANESSVSPPGETANDAIFARRIRILRRVLGISASELDSRAGFGVGTTGRLERGEVRIYASHLYRIGEITGVGIDYFYIGLDGEPAAENPDEAEIKYLVNCLKNVNDGHIRDSTATVAEMIYRELASDQEQD